MNRRPGASRRGFTLVEVVASAAVLLIALLGIVSMARMAAATVDAAKETEVARAAASRVRALCAVERIRASDAADTGEWLFRGGYEIARAADGSAFLMPDVRARAPVVEGIGGAVVVEFPVAPLAPLEGRVHAGRLVLYVSEPAQPASLPAQAFPLAPTLGMTRLDCDGDGAASTGDTRLANGASAHPCRLVPGKVVVEWRGAGGHERRIEEWFLLGYAGHD